MFVASSQKTMANARTQAAIAALRDRERKVREASAMDERRRLQRLEEREQAVVKAAAEITRERIAMRTELQRAYARLRQMEDEMRRPVQPSELVTVHGAVSPRVADCIVTMKREELQLAACRVYRPSLTIILHRVARATGVREIDIVSERRSRPIVFARQMFCYWAARITLKSFPEIGRFIGGRDHTTVLHGVRVYPEKRQATGRALRPYGGRL